MRSEYKPVKTVVFILSVFLFSCSSNSKLNLSDYLYHCNEEFTSASKLFFDSDYLNAKNNLIAYHQLDTIAFNYESYAFLAECYNQLGKRDSGRIVYCRILNNLKEREKILYRNKIFAISDLEKWKLNYPDFPNELRKENGFIANDNLPEPIGGIGEIKNNVIYPRSSKNVKLKGKVLVSTLINKQGEPIDFDFYISLSNDYDKAAVDAIRRTKFTSPKRKGRPCNMWITIPIVYN